MVFYNYHQVRTFVILLIGFYLMLLPALLRAQVVINEIMYDPEGSDTGREWIEVYNTGESDVDLATYKFFESNANHKIVLTGGENSSILKSHQFAIVADNPEKILIDFPDFTGFLFDSTFSLNNTGEPLVIIDAVGNTVDHFEYTSDFGAGNNGNSLQKNEAGFWLEASPTIGALNKQESQLKEENSGSDTLSTSTTINSTHAGQTEITQYSEKNLLEVGVGRNRFSTLRTPIEFKAEYNTDKKPKFMWTWGDGTYDFGYKNSHIYENPGAYNVVLNAFLNGYQATSRVKTVIYDIYVDILYITSGKLVDIMLKNNSENEVNLGGFIIKTSLNQFKIPTDTIIDAKSQIIISGKNTGFKISSSTEPVKLYYPDGSLYKETILIPTSTSPQMI